MEYSKQEKLDMVECFFNSNKNSTLAVQLYEERFPERQVPSRKLISKIMKNLNNYGSFTVKRKQRESKITEEEETLILAYVESNPKISIREISMMLAVPYYRVQKVLKKHNYHDYKYTPVQTLQVGDEARRFVFCEWLLTKAERSNSFYAQIIWTDEANFSNKGMFNRKNNHYWSQKNPLDFVETCPQQRFSINCWCALLGSKVLAIHFYDGNLNGPRYIEFLSEALADCLEDFPLAQRQQLYFQHDGAPPHNSGPVADLLQLYFPNKWIGNNGPIMWPARSPDLTPLDFFVWGHVKNEVYKNKYASVNELREKVDVTVRSLSRDMIRRATRSVVKRARICLEQNGFHFEHLL